MTAERSSIGQGFAADASDPQTLAQALEVAVDYRGDVAITRRSVVKPVEGYVFDRQQDRQTGGWRLRMIERETGERIVIPQSEIVRIEFTGRDTASGKSFENWVKRYIESKRAGECANIESEPLDPEKVPDTGV